MSAVNPSDFTNRKTDEASAEVDATISVEEPPALPPVPAPPPTRNPVPTPVAHFTILQLSPKAKLEWILQTEDMLPRQNQDCSLQLTGKNSGTDDINFDYIQIQYPVSGNGDQGLLDAGQDDKVEKAVTIEISTTKQKQLSVKIQLVIKDDQKFCSLEIVHGGGGDDDKSFFTLAADETVTLIIKGHGGTVGMHNFRLHENIVDAMGEFQEFKDTSAEVAVLKAEEA